MSVHVHVVVVVLGARLQSCSQASVRLRAPMTLALAGLFLVAFLAGSVVPLPSEAALAAEVIARRSAVTPVAIATVGNVLGALTLFWLGRWAAARSEGRVHRWLQAKGARAEARAARAKAWMRRWGAPALLMTWLPWVGDALVLGAGAVGVRPVPFVVFTALGKGLRYAAVAAAVLGAWS